MNDNHDSTNAYYAPLIFRANKFKQAHPELLLGSIDKRPKIGTWGAVNYGRPEIRELAFRFAEEVCKNYDVDGLELDFFRHCVFFKSTSRGEIATEEERTGMTELVARIRKMADEVGQARGRPILIAARVPDSVEYCHAIGLDLERWLSDDLLDIYIPSGTFRLNDWEYSVALARKHGVKVYPSLDDSRVRDPAGKERRMTNLAYRSRAANVWAAGADGVYLYNFFSTLKSDQPLLNEMGSPTILAKLDKDYLPAARGIVNTSGGNLPNESYRHCETLNPSKPKLIAPGEAVAARVHVGEKFELNDSAGVKLRLQFAELQNAELIRVAINSHNLNVKSASDNWLEGVPSKSDLRPGSNTIEVSLSDKAPRPAKWLDVALQVRFPASH